MKNISVEDSVKKLMAYVREGEYCSCPFTIVVDGKIRVALFTYFAMDDEQIVVYGYGQFLSCDGDNVYTEEKALFENESDLIAINDKRMVSVGQHKVMYDAYYRALQYLVENYYSGDRQRFVDNTANAFKKLIPSDAFELYRRVCPEFLKLLNI